MERELINSQEKLEELVTRFNTSIDIDGIAMACFDKIIKTGPYDSGVCGKPLDINKMKRWLLSTSTLNLAGSNVFLQNGYFFRDGKLFEGSLFVDFENFYNTENGNYKLIIEPENIRFISADSIRNYFTNLDMKEGIGLSEQQYLSLLHTRKEKVQL